VKVKHVKNDSLKVYLQKICLKEKVKQVEEQELGSKLNLKKKKKSKVKVKHVGKGLTSKIQIENIDQISNQRFRKYLDYC